MPARKMSSNLMNRGSQIFCLVMAAEAMLLGQIICEPLFIRLELILLAGIVAIPMRDGQANSPEELKQQTQISHCTYEDSM